MQHYEVLVVGAGPVGATLVSLLASQQSIANPSGRCIGLIEQTDRSQTFSRAVSLGDEEIRVLESEFANTGMFPFNACADLQVLTQWNLSLEDSPKLLIGQPIGPGRPGNWAKWQPRQKIGVSGYPAGGYAFWQPDLEMALKRKIDSVKSKVDLLTMRTVIGVEDLPDGTMKVTMERRKHGSFGQDAGGEWRWVEDEKPIAMEFVTCRFLVGCDGAKSTVRQLRFPRMKTYDYDVKWIVVDMLCDEDKADHVFPSFSQFLVGTRQTILIAGAYTTGKDGARKKHLRIDWELLKDDDANAIVLPENIEKLLAPMGFTKANGCELSRASVYSLHALMTPTMQQGNVFLAGNAAHLMPPFLGRGLNTGLQDVHELAWRLTAAIALFPKASPQSNLLAGYNAIRHLAATIAVQGSASMGHLCTELGRSPIVRDEDKDAFRKKMAATTTYADRYKQRRTGDLFAGNLFPQFVSKLNANKKSDQDLFQSLTRPVIGTLIYSSGSGELRLSAKSLQKMRTYQCCIVEFANRLSEYGITPSQLPIDRVFMVLPNRLIIASAPINFADDVVDALMDELLGGQQALMTSRI